MTVNDAVECLVSNLWILFLRLSDLPLGDVNPFAIAMPSDEAIELYQWDCVSILNDSVLAEMEAIAVFLNFGLIGNRIE